MSMQKDQPESIVFLSEESKRAQRLWAAEMESEGQGSVESSGDNGDKPATRCWARQFFL